MNFKTIRTKLKAALDDINGLTADNLRASPDPPCAIVLPRTPMRLDLTFDGMQEPTFIVLVLVPYVDVDDAQVVLDEFLATEGPQSIKEKLESDQTLGGTVSNVWVRDIGSYGVISLRDGGTEYLSAELFVEITL